MHRAPRPRRDCSTFPICDDTEATCGDAGTCVAAGAVGDACDDSVLQPCLVGLTCGDDLTCTEQVSFDDAPPTCN